MKLKRIHVRQTTTEIEIGTGNGCERKTGTKTGKETGKDLEKETGTRTGIGKKTGIGKRTGIETELETETEIATVIVIAKEIVRRGGTVVASVPPEVRAVEGAHEEHMGKTTTEIGRWRKEWGCEQFALYASFEHGHFFVSLSKAYIVSGTSPCCCIFISV